MAPYAHQLAYRQGNVAAGRCCMCPRPRVTAVYCELHRAEHNERVRGGPSTKAYACSRCRQPGHDARTCPALHPVPAGERPRPRVTAEAIAAAKRHQRDLTAPGRCPRCNLLEPHECVKLDPEARRDGGLDRHAPYQTSQRGGAR